MWLLTGAMLIVSGVNCQNTRRDTVHVQIETTKGTFEVELYPDDAPKTVANFVGLAEEGYYNGVLFHRIAKNFFLQGGDSTGTGAGGRSIYGGDFADELNPKAPSYQTGYVRGTLAMANRGPNTNTSQFFIVLNDAQYLPKHYTIFGKVVKAMDVVDSLAAVPITPMMGPMDGTPKEKIKMIKLTVIK